MFSRQILIEGSGCLPCLTINEAPRAETLVWRPEISPDRFHWICLSESCCYSVVHCQWNCKTSEGLCIAVIQVVFIWHGYFLQSIESVVAQCLWVCVNDQKVLPSNPMTPRDPVTVSLTNVYVHRPFLSSNIQGAVCRYIIADIIHSYSTKSCRTWADSRWGT